MRDALAYLAWGSLVPLGLLLHLHMGGAGTSLAFLLFVASGLGTLYTVVRDDPLPIIGKSPTEEAVEALIARGSVPAPAARVPALGPRIPARAPAPLRPREATQACALELAEAPGR